MEIDIEIKEVLEKLVKGYKMITVARIYAVDESILGNVKQNKERKKILLSYELPSGTCDWPILWQTFQQLSSFIYNYIKGIVGPDNTIGYKNI